ncbi:MAG: hypothetical protein A3E80_02560 [Chlamydiae bacterium RIFCSPHIGHO2_12_FULL_49_9]|nr:MAG: hypothetical protein A3E80_02560 [Chlamydiae bacterium RIFCSPHIGHO2_12_FULL_49_9]
MRKIYPGKGGHLAVDGISFELGAGEILGLLGPNGSGKTTTIQMLLGTLSFSSGEIYYFGRDFPKHRSEVLQKVSFASTYTSLPWLLTVQENLEVMGRLYGIGPKEASKRFFPLLERFGILDKKDVRVSALSAGQITRLVLVKAFFIDPKIVLLDEPTASLDPEMAKEICQFILEEREKRGLSILFTSHKMDEAAQLCDRVIFLKNGKIIANDVPKKLARSISAFQVRLVVPDGMKRTVALAEKEKLSYQVERRTIQVTLEEGQIPTFLTALAQEGVVYSNIKIEEPSLEDYFLQIARKQK